ncbi:MAG: glycerol-3-phosphate acyltransferase [Anaerolineaceae bacterium]|jgi:glycerol-3-phosphate acyltransferase PlsY
MAIFPVLAVLALSYLAGSIPFGLIIVKIANGKDVRAVESGRTGGTNVFRAAGWFAGVLTAFMDIIKGVATAWIVMWFMPGDIWLQVLAAIMAIVGHNYSIFLIERNERGRLRLRGGAGGATALGGAIALWPQAWLIILPLAVLVYLIIGYASITTISIAFFAIVIFAYRAITEMSPWIYVFYGIAAELIVLWALRPNLKRLFAGNERAVGIRAYLLKKIKNPSS